jgi:hypothetical protein
MTTGLTIKTLLVLPSFHQLDCPSVRFEHTPRKDDSEASVSKIIIKIISFENVDR